jgi:ribonuclease T2
MRLLLALLLTLPAFAQDFSHYLLVLSYAPDFCAQPTGRKDPRECGPGRKLGFIVHGLWPQNDQTRGPENCSGSPVSRSIIQATLPYIPVDSLIQHEWRTHGTCSGLTAAEYFAALRKARDSIRVPAELDQPASRLTLTPAQIQAKLAAANPRLPASAIALSCYRDDELQEIRICLNKDFTPRACTASAAHCTAKQLTLLPVK